MTGWVHMTDLQKWQALYIQAYKDAWECKPPRLPPSRWESEAWLEQAVEDLIDAIMAIKTQTESQNCESFNPKQYKREIAHE